MSFSVRYIERVTKYTQWHCNETPNINKLSVTRLDFDFQQHSTISQNFWVFPVCNQIRQYKMDIIITTVVCNEYCPFIDRMIKSPLKNSSRAFDHLIHLMYELANNHHTIHRLDIYHIYS